MNKVSSHRALSLLAVLCCASFSLAAAEAAGAEPARGAQAARAEQLKHRGVYAPPPLIRPGQPVARLPDGYLTVRVRRHPYYYHHGVFYRPHPSHGFVVVGAPLGARVTHLPPGSVSFWMRDRHYFYVNLTYYLWDAADREYVVVRAPSGATEALLAANGRGSSELFVYPARGQSDEQRDRDRYECYLWAVDQVGYDPAGTRQDFALAADYRRALTACLEGRGYTVR